MISVIKIAKKMSLPTIEVVKSCPLESSECQIFLVNFLRLKTHLKTQKQFDVKIVRSELECKYIYAPMFQIFPMF